MNIKAFYIALGGDYEAALRCFRTEEKLCGYLRKLLREPNFEKLFSAAEREDAQEAFEAAHALKGVVGMFGLTRLSDAVCALADALRTRDISENKALLRRVQREYDAFGTFLETLPQKKP